MQTLIVVDSEFGNTRQIAQAIADGVGRYTAVEVVPVDEAAAQPAPGTGLIIVGGPTHAHGLSSHMSRQVNPTQAAQGATPGRIGLREWLAGLGSRAEEPLAAAFDTRFRKPRWLTGSAATSAAKRLRARGYRMIAPPESFFVEHGPGPLLPDELDRARDWGEHLGAAVAIAEHPTA